MLASLKGWSYMRDKENLVCKIDKKLLERFRNEVLLRQQQLDDVVEELIYNYLMQSLKSFLKHERVSPKPIKPADSKYKKALNKIELWKNRPHQNNHKILKAFWELEGEVGEVTADALEARCSNKERFPETYVEKFKGNFDQMKTDKGNSNGKVFVVSNDGEVVLWEAIYDEISQYKRFFLKT